MIHYLIILSNKKRTKTFEFILGSFLECEESEETTTQERSESENEEEDGRGRRKKQVTSKFLDFVMGKYSWVDQTFFTLSGQSFSIAPASQN
jgi:hypothetical protein